jgi:hypothetical protein
MRFGRLTNSYLDFTGTINKVSFKLGASQLGDVEKEAAAKAIATARD